jgi:hypothetical protein
MIAEREVGSVRATIPPVETAILESFAIILLALTVGEPQRHHRSQTRPLPVPVPFRTQRQIAMLGDRTHWSRS